MILSDDEVCSLKTVHPQLLFSEEFFQLMELITL